MIPAIEQLRQQIERRYVGLSPSTRAKAVHIANGLFRGVLKKTWSTDQLYRFVIAQDNRGRCPKHHELTTLKNELLDNGRLDQCDDKALALLRTLLHDVLGADNAIFPGGFESYSAGQAAFVTRDRVGQDGGEFVAEWLRRSQSPLYDVIRDSLNDDNDILSRLAMPLLSQDQPRDRPDGAVDYDKVGFFKIPASRLPAVFGGLRDAAETMASNLRCHPNKLTRLRTSVLFTMFALMRYLASLENLYAPSLSGIKIVPFVIDCGYPGNATLSTASVLTYQRSCQAIARFYAWAFGECLKRDFALPEILRAKTPVYKAGKKQTSDRERQEVSVLWKLAKERAKKHHVRGARAFSPFCIVGEALYDILALQAEAEPVEYFRQLGVRSGLLYPPNSSTNRFLASEDMLEMLIQGAVSGGETLEVSELLDRLWLRYGVIIGGQEDDELRLREAAIMQIDGDSLALNRIAFGETLGSLDFATLLPDGVLKINIGVPHEH